MQKMQTFFKILFLGEFKQKNIVPLTISYAI